MKAPRTRRGLAALATTLAAMIAAAVVVSAAWFLTRSLGVRLEHGAQALRAEALLEGALDEAAHALATRMDDPTRDPRDNRDSWFRAVRPRLGARPPRLPIEDSLDVPGSRALAGEAGFALGEVRASVVEPTVGGSLPRTRLILEASLGPSRGRGPTRWIRAVRTVYLVPVALGAEGPLGWRTRLAADPEELSLGTR